MSYIINNSRGQIVAVIPDGVVNTSATNLALIGQAVTNYGTYQNENYLYLLENFASGTAPTTPILGQLWYNANTDTLSAYNSANTWSAIATQSYVDVGLTALLISPSFSGVPTAPTAPGSTNTNQIATTAFVKAQLSNTSSNISGGNISSSGSISATGNITGGNIIALGNVTAAYLNGNVSGNISGNITIGGANTQVVFNDGGVANATAGFTFNKVSNAVTMSGTLTVDTVVANTVVTTGTTSAFRLPNLTQAQINALSPQNGDMVYNTTQDLPQVYQGGSWKNFTISYYS